MNWKIVMSYQKNGNAYGDGYDETGYGYTNGNGSGGGFGFSSGGGITGGIDYGTWDGNGRGDGI